VSDELRDLRWAIAASQHRSLRRAAEALNIRQSTLSRRLRDLECRRGAQLFERTNGGTKPTPAGREFLAGARRVLESADQIFTKVETYAKGESGHLTIGVYTSLAAGNLRATLIEHHARFPNVSVRMIDGRLSELFADLSANMIDVNIVAAGDVDWDDCRLPLWSERVVVALPKEHILIDRPAVRWEELRNEHLIIPERGPAPEFKQLLARKLGNYALERTLPQAVGLDRLLSLVGIWNDPLLVLEGATGAQYEGVIYREVHDSDGPTRLDFSAYWRHENDNPTLRSFLDILRSRYPNLRRKWVAP
jgi:DNA-binding transcriptional LysR family regulator